MSQLQPRDPKTAIGEVLPQRPASPTPSPVHAPGAKRYLAPILLVAMATAINVIAFLTPDPEAPTPEAAMVKTEMSVEDKITAAEQLKAHGDQLYEEGYSWVNDNDKLKGAHAAYTKAWELITSKQYPEGGGEASLIADTVQCSILQEHLRIRLTTLDETFARNQKIEGYIPKI